MRPDSVTTLRPAATGRADAARPDVPGDGFQALLDGLATRPEPRRCGQDAGRRVRGEHAPDRAARHDEGRRAHGRPEQPADAPETPAAEVVVAEAPAVPADEAAPAPAALPPVAGAEAPVVPPVAPADTPSPATVPPPAAAAAPAPPQAAEAAPPAPVEPAVAAPAAAVPAPADAPAEAAVPEPEVAAPAPLPADAAPAQPHAEPASPQPGTGDTGEQPREQSPAAQPAAAAEAPAEAAPSAPQPHPAGAEPSIAADRVAPPTTATPPQPAAATAQPAVATPQRSAPLHQAPRAVAQLLHVAIERSRGSDSPISHARLNLRPAELGGIEIRLQTSAAGVTAQVVADSPDAARLLQQAADDLRRSLERHDVTLLALDVSTSGDDRSAGSAGAQADLAGDRARELHGLPREQGRDGERPEEEPVVIETVQLPDGVHVDVLA